MYNGPRIACGLSELQSPKFIYDGCRIQLVTMAAAIRGIATPNGYIEALFQAAGGDTYSGQDDAHITQCLAAIGLTSHQGEMQDTAQLKHAVQGGKLVGMYVQYALFDVNTTLPIDYIYPLDHWTLAAGYDSAADTLLLFDNAFVDASNPWSIITVRNRALDRIWTGVEETDQAKPQYSPDGRRVRNAVWSDRFAITID